MIISSQKLFQNLTLQDEGKTELKAWINLESRHSLFAFFLRSPYWPPYWMLHIRPSEYKALGKSAPLPPPAGLTATCERCFSTMKRLKTSLKTNMEQITLTRLLTVKNAKMSIKTFIRFQSNLLAVYNKL